MFDSYYYSLESELTLALMHHRVLEKVNVARTGFFYITQERFRDIYDQGHSHYTAFSPWYRKEIEEQHALELNLPYHYVNDTGCTRVWEA